jgi:hypothetical protein
MNFSQFMDDTVQKVDQIDWKQVTKDLLDLWVTVFNGLVILGVFTYITGKILGHVIHNVNDWLATKWLQVLGLAGPTKLGRASPLTVEIAEETIVVEVEPMLPPTNDEVVETPALDEKTPPSPRRRRRQSRPPAVAVTEELELSHSRRPRGRGAHKRRHQAA